MFNWLGFIDRIKGGLPNPSHKKSPDPQAQAKNAEPTGGPDPLDRDASGISLNFSEIEFDYRSKIGSSDEKHFKNEFDTYVKFDGPMRKRGTYVKFDGPMRKLGGHKDWIEILSHSFGSRFLRPSVLIPACLAIGGCIALGFLLFGEESSDGGSANQAKTGLTVTMDPQQIDDGNTAMADISTTRLPTSTTVGSTPVSASPVTTIKVAVTPAPTVAQTVTPTTTTAVVTTAPPKSDVDPRFESCEQAMKEGFGPYLKGKDREYEWYPDDNRDGVVCDK